MENGGRFKPGHSRSKGRPKGATNKISREIKAKIAEFVDGQMGYIQEWFDELDAKDKLFYLKEFMPFVIPKMKELSGEVENTNPLLEFDKMNPEDKKQLLDLIVKYQLADV